MLLKEFEFGKFDEIYEIMEQSFPDDERRTYEEQKRLLENPLYHIYVLQDMEESSIQAFAAVWIFDSMLFLEHFAVHSRYRNLGLGARMLHEIVTKLGKMVVLEVEPPETELAARRIDFYRRNGFFFHTYPYIQPAMSDGRKEIPLFLMTSERAISEEEFYEIRDLLYEQVYHVKGVPQQSITHRTP